MMVVMCTCSNKTKTKKKAADDKFIKKIDNKIDALKSAWKDTGVPKLLERIDNGKRYGWNQGEKKNKKDLNKVSTCADGILTTITKQLKVVVTKQRKNFPVGDRPTKKQIRTMSFAELENKMSELVNACYSHNREKKKAKRSPIWIH